jgi:hypothetical protein
MSYFRWTIDHADILYTFLDVAQVWFNAHIIKVEHENKEKIRIIGFWTLSIVRNSK